MLPPGQRAIDDFPRFGTHLHRPAPPVPADPAIEVGGAVTRPFAVPLAELAALPRRELTADFHCVAGWAATGLPGGGGGRGPPCCGGASPSRASIAPSSSRRCRRAPPSRTWSSSGSTATGRS